MPESAGEFPSVLFVCLGASNLARGRRALTHCLEINLHPRPARFLYAHGPGRGYCAWGGVLHVVYPPIGASRVLDAAREKAEKASHVVALVTDIGNDIMYDIPVETITACLDRIFQQLSGLNARILVTPIPSYFETDLGELSFRCLRGIFYPRSKVDHGQAVLAIQRINKFLGHAVSENVSLISGLENFMGWDKIHYSLLKSHLAWSRIAAEMLRGLNLDHAKGIGFRGMLGSFGSNITQLVTSDFLSLRAKGPEYF